MAIPKYDQFFNPLLRAMHELGGSASIDEQEDRVAAILNLSDKDLAEIHRGSRTKVQYRLAWARTYLKHYGLLENSARGIWTLTPKGLKTHTVDARAVNRKANKGRRGEPLPKEDKLPKEIAWEEKLLGVLKSLPADAFERLSQRVLRESGFTQVEVTGRSGDGGIDGKGVVRIGGVLSFHVIFQCKRYKGSVGPGVIRDLRGAMMGRADKGLLLTTGTITRDARKEAQRDGATPIDLIDGEDFVRRLRDLGMGVNIMQHIVEDIRVNRSFFEGI
ncbi:MAG TPA: restriction endonuclease [Pyrinomonadaceae bacterium]|jgi:restriction system protein|nr:restriction endonuclease [Pyrinomonadaceae bacterium]